MARPETDATQRNDRLATGLDGFLADSYLLMGKTQACHWNVTGPNFIAVHEMLDPEVEAVLAQADETAERIATLGGTPDGRADAIVRNRTWKSFDAEGRVGTEEYLKALIEYYDAFIADDRKAIAELDELDVISSNIIQDHVQELEKFQWFMRSHLA